MAENSIYEKRYKENLHIDIGHSPVLAQLVEHLTVVVFICYQMVAGSIPADRNIYIARYVIMIV